MISILCPTRGRPELFERMLKSMHELSEFSDTFEVLGYVDNDDPCRTDYDTLITMFDLLIVDEPRSVGEAWNVLAQQAQGDYFLMGNDDQVYMTPHWDRLLLDILSERMPKDGMFVAWVDDKTGKAARRCAFPIVSRKWYETLNYFTPECFNFLYHDTWIWDIGKRLDRTFYIPEIVIEHRHFAFKKADYDDTYQHHRVGVENSRKREADKQMFNSTAGQRQADAEKLKDLIVSTALFPGGVCNESTA